MPWYVWLLIVLTLGSIIGGLFVLRDSAKKLPLTEEQLKRIHERNAALDAQEKRDN